MAKQRDGVLDAMRGIGIVLMVVGHSGFAGTAYIYLFHMALFFMLSGYFFRLGEGLSGLRHFCVRRLVTLWLPFVAANTVFTVCNNLFLKLNILTNDARILDLPGNQITTPVTLKDIVGRTVHWCVFDAAPSWAGRSGSSSAVSDLQSYVVVEFALRKLLAGRDTLLAQGFVAGVLLILGWQCSARAGTSGVWASPPAATAVLPGRAGPPRRPACPHSRCTGGAAAAAALVLALLLPFGSVGLAANQYPSWLFLLMASAAGWILVYECAHLAALLPPLGKTLAAWAGPPCPSSSCIFSASRGELGGIATHRRRELSSGGLPHPLHGGAWWLAYTVSVWALPLLATSPTGPRSRPF